MRLGMKGQSIVEYVLIITAVIAVVMVFAAGLFRTNLQDSLEHVSDEMQTQVERIGWPPD